MFERKGHKIYHFHEAKKAELKFKIWWQYKDGLSVGDWVLTDNGYVVQVLEVNKQFFCVVDWEQCFKDVYFVIPGSKRWTKTTAMSLRRHPWTPFKFPDFDQVPLIHDSYPCPVEEMVMIKFVEYFTGVFDTSLQKAVEYVWSGHSVGFRTKMYQRIKNIDRFRGILMDLMRNLFEKAGVFPEDIVKRLDSNTKEMSDIVKQLKRKGASADDLIKVVEAAHKMNLEFLALYAGVGQNPMGPNIDNYQGSMKYIQHAEYQEIEAKNVREGNNNGANTTLPTRSGVDDGQGSKSLGEIP